MSPKFDRRESRPRQHVATAGRLYPEAWRGADRIRSGRGVHYPAWPDWCYLPIAAAQAIVAEDAGINGSLLATLYPQRLPDAARLAGLAAWRMTQGIYRFDPAVYEAVRETPVSGDIPHDVLFRLPEWCVYLETPGMAIGGEPVHGAFAHLEWDAHSGQAELRLLLDVDLGDRLMLTPIPLHLGAWTLAEAIDRTVAFASARGREYGHGEVPPGADDALRRTVEPIVSLLLYLCSQAAEVGSASGARPQNPQPKRVKGGWRLFPAERVTTWDVGLRMGAALRRAYQAAETHVGDLRAGPRPHIRRAHWHTVLSGPRIREGVPIPSDERVSELRWMPPIAVNVDDPDQLPAVVRRVE